jgi:RNA polymerase sigma factor (sigma-70 family)
VRTEDGALVYKCLNGEPEMFCILVDKYKASIYALVYNRLKNFHDAEDVTQEVFLQAFKNLRKLKNFDNFAIWLSSIASNLSKRWIRSNIRRIDHDFIEDKDQKVLENPSMDSYRDSEISESLHDALDSLPEIYQQVLTLHYLGGMSGMEIARTLGISHDTVRQRLSRARAQLREEMIAMMSQTFQQQKLSASFTFRIVELVKKIRINPVSEPKNLPWGLSLGAGLIFAFLMFGQHIQINLPNTAMGLPLPSDMKVLKVGEIPIDAVKISTITSIGNKGIGKGFAPDPKGQENAFFMSPQGEGGTWAKKADMPTARVCFSVTEVNGKIYVISGLSQNGASSTVEEYDPLLDKWTIKANIPTPRLLFCSVAANGKIYAMGGDPNLSTVEEYDPLTNTWKIKSPMPSGKSSPSAFTINGKIYVLGGYADSRQLTASLSFYSYDPEIDQWLQLNDIPPAFAMAESTQVVYKDDIYFLGGVNPANWQAIEKIIVYNTKSDTWKMMKSSIVTRNFGVAGIINDKIYFIGGEDWRQAWKGLSDVEEYDIATDTISKKLEMPNRRGFNAGCVYGNSIYVFGGTTGWPGNAPNDFLSINEVYTPDTAKSVNPNEKLPKTWGMLKAK